MTKAWYDTAPESWITATRNVDITSHYNRFIPNMPPNAHILEIGCGAGRDAKYFTDMFFHVTAIDISENMCMLTKEYTGPDLDVRCMSILDLDSSKKYDGVWALAALVHATDEELPQMLLKIKNSMQSGAEFYTVFKYAEQSWYDSHGRFYNWMTTARLETLLRDAGFENINIVNEADRMGRSEEWLCVSCHSPAPALDMSPS